MNLQSLKNKLLMALGLYYLLPILYLMLCNDTRDIFVAIGLQTVLLIIVPLILIFYVCLLPPVWILVAWYLFVKHGNKD